MNEVVRLLLMLLLAGAVLTLIGGAVIWYMEEERRIRRGLRHVLGAAPEAVVIARGRGRGAGFSFATGLAAVAWDSGAWCLVYRIDELTGAELLVDGAVVARAFRGEARRALDQVVDDAGQVTLRLVFDDAKDPDFDLDLWIVGDDARRAKASPAAAVKEANRWMARAEAILRRPLAPHPAPAEIAPAQDPVAIAPEPAAPVFRQAGVTPAAPTAADPLDSPPWEDDAIEEDSEFDGDEEDWPDLPKRIS